MFRTGVLLRALAALYFIRLVHSFAMPANGGGASPAQPDPTLPEPPDTNLDGDPPAPLIGDLLNGITTPIGQSIANILLGTEAGMSSYTEPPPAKRGINGCKSSKDPCCIWYSVAEDLTDAFKGPTGRCNNMARAAIRLGFHDAGPWSQKLAAAGQDFGGADGSFVLFNEIQRTENRGLEAIALKAAALYMKYRNSGVGMADLIQFMATHATVTCPLGPRVRTFIGRKDANRAAPNGLLPSVTSDADTLIALFKDKTIAPHELAALLGAHSTSKQFFVSPENSGRPQDSTPGIWDVSFYNETLQPKPARGTFRFASDAVIAADPRTSDEWHQFVGDQHHWNEDYSRAYVHLSLLGVNVINGLAECTKVLPAAQLSFEGSTTSGVDQRRVKRSLSQSRDIIREEAKRGGCTG